MAVVTANTPIESEDVLPVRSRISWPAVLAGGVLALALYLLLTLLGGAVGLTISNRVDHQQIGVGAAVYAIVVTGLCMFVGGYVASQLTSGENKQEGCIYGIMVWAVVFAMILWLAASGVQAGFSTLVGISTAARSVPGVQDAAQKDWETIARENGASEQDITDFRAKLKTKVDQAKADAQDPAKQEEARKNTSQALWYTFLGTLLSMAMAATGGWVGAGPRLRLFQAVVARPLGTTGGYAGTRPV